MTTSWLSPILWPKDPLAYVDRLDALYSITHTISSPRDITVFHEDYLTASTILVAERRIQAGKVSISVRLFTQRQTPSYKPLISCKWR